MVACCTATRWHRCHQGWAGLASVQDILERAGERAVLQVGEWRYSLWGFPDLRRPTSRVVAISPGGTLGEVVALHRFPAQVGTCVRGEGGWVTSRDRPVAEVGGPSRARCRPKEARYSPWRSRHLR